MSPGWNVPLARPIAPVHTVQDGPGEKGPGEEPSQGVTPRRSKGAEQRGEETQSGVTETQQTRWPPSFFSSSGGGEGRCSELMTDTVVLGTGLVFMHGFALTGYGSQASDFSCLALYFNRTEQK